MALSANTPVNFHLAFLADPIRHMTPPPDITKPKKPIARARSPGSEKRSMISDSATADTAAPPSPWTARAATSQARLTLPGETANSLPVSEFLGHQRRSLS